MRDQRIRDESPERDHWDDHRVVLDLLIQSYPAHWTSAELSRVLCPSTGARTGSEPPSARVADALNDLYGAGLIHRIGDFAFASRAAVEASHLNE